MNSKNEIQPFTGFDGGSLTLQPLSITSIELGKQDMPFLAFNGPQKPLVTIQEYQKGNKGITKEKYDVDNGYGAMGKGAYKFRYDMIWNGEPNVYGSTKQIEKMDGSIIMKEGEVKCTPGYVLKNGNCVLENIKTICQPGWRDVNGVCVKNPKEFMEGDAYGSTAVNYPVSTDATISLGRLRNYIQEKATVGNGFQEPSKNAGYYITIVLIIFVIIYIFSKRT